MKIFVLLLIVFAVLIFFNLLNKRRERFQNNESKKEDIERLKKIQEQIHENFISYVKSRRGNKLSENNLEEIFSGLFWVGQKGIDLGLADGLGSINEIIENKFGKKAKIKIIDQKKSFLQKKLSSSFIDSDAVLQKIEEKALWSRYGL